MRKILNMIILCLSFVICFILFINTNLLSDNLTKIIQKEPTVVIQPQNEYTKKEKFLFVEETDNFKPLSKKDIKNIYYTVVNRGWNDFTFYCPSEYSNCLQDVKQLSQDQDLLTHINNYVHPFNGFSNVKTLISETGNITISITYFYEEKDKLEINKKVEEIYKKNITSDMDDETKIKVIHDYIINNAKYDVERNNIGSSKYHSYLAYGPLIEGYATCNGYTDAMALFLTKMNIPNFKVAMTPEEKNKEGHVWNAVFINNEWRHLDLTWDDPVSNDGKDYLQHKYFLITTKELKEIDDGEVNVEEHNFKRNVYLELKETSN